MDVGPIVHEMAHGGFRGTSVRHILNRLSKPPSHQFAFWRKARGKDFVHIPRPQ